jgi:hypothetical protein
MARITTALFLASAMLAIAGPAGASLQKNLHRFLSNTTTPTLANVVEPISPIVGRIAARGIDFPVTSTTPGFTYHYDPSLGMFARSSKSLGPEFLERAETIGRGRFDVGMSYLYADLTDFDGENFANDIFFGTQSSRGGVDVAGVFSGTDFSLQSHVFSFFGTYGITDRWDVNLILPLVYTKLELEGVAGFAVGTGAPVVGAVRFSDFFEDDAFGPGDLQVRTKYRFLEGGPVDFAGTFALRLPTGDEADFHGLGDVTLTPSLIASRLLGPHEIHAQLGVEVNADDLERSRMRYGIGGELQILEMLALTVEIIGSSAFVDDEFDVPTRGSIVPPFSLTGNRFVKRQGPESITAIVPRSDVVDGAVGFKINIAGNAVGYLGAIIPMTEDSLRADFLPVGGIEVSF